MKKMIVSLSVIALVVALATSAMAADWKGVPANKVTTVVPGVVFDASNNKEKVVILTIADDAYEGTLTVEVNVKGTKTQTVCDAAGSYTFSTANGNISYLWVCDCQWDDGVVTVEPTCTEDGVMTFTCSQCGATRTEAIEAVGHSIVSYGTDASYFGAFEDETSEYTNYQAATCTTGETWVRGWAACEHCGGEFVARYWGYGEEALGHDFHSIIWDGWGWLASDCSRCDWEGYISYDHCFFGHSTELNSCQDVCEWCGEVGSCLELCEVCGECLACGDCPGHGLTVEQWIAAITDAINDAGGIIADLVDSTDRYSITLTINGEDYKFTGGNSATADKSCVIDGVTYIINVRGNGTWVVIRG